MNTPITPKQTENEEIIKARALLKRDSVLFALILGLFWLSVILLPRFRGSSFAVTYTYTVFLLFLYFGFSVIIKTHKVGRLAGLNGLVVGLLLAPAFFLIALGGPLLFAWLLLGHVSTAIPANVIKTETDSPKTPRKRPKVIALCIALGIGILFLFVSLPGLLSAIKYERLATAKRTMNQGRFEEAIHLYEKVIKADPKMPAPYLNLAICLHHEKRDAEALKAARQYLTLAQHENKLSRQKNGLEPYPVSDTEIAWKLIREILHSPSPAAPPVPAGPEETVPAESPAVPAIQT